MKPTFLALIMILCVTTDASADERPWSLGFSAGIAGEDFDDTEGLDFDNGGIYGTRLGFQLNERFAVEAEVERFASFDGDGNVPGLGRVSAEIDGWIVSANGRFYLSTSGARPYLLAGVGYMRADIDLSARSLGVAASVSDDDSSAVFQLGVGATLPVNDSWLLELEGTYRRPTSDLRDLCFWTTSLALQYRF